MDFAWFGISNTVCSDNGPQAHIIHLEMDRPNGLCRELREFCSKMFLCWPWTTVPHQPQRKKLAQQPFIGWKLCTTLWWCADTGEQPDTRKAGPIARQRDAAERSTRLSTSTRAQDMPPVEVVACSLLCSLPGGQEAKNQCSYVIHSSGGVEKRRNQHHLQVLPQDVVRP